jgi:hypothetical protein
MEEIQLHSGANQFSLPASIIFLNKMLIHAYSSRIMKVNFNVTWHVSVQSINQFVLVMEINQLCWVWLELNF